MDNNAHWWIAAVLSVFAWSWWNGEDDDYVPRRLIGMGAYMYDNLENQEHYAGFSPGNYWDKETLLQSCRSNSAMVALQLEIDDWSYVCCTVTKETQCRTKVR